MNAASSLEVPADIPVRKRDALLSLHQRLLEPQVGMTEFVKAELDEVMEDLDVDETHAITTHLAYLQEHLVNGHALNTFRYVREAFSKVLGGKSKQPDDKIKPATRNIVRDYFESTNFITANLLQDEEFRVEIDEARTGEKVVELVEAHTQDDRTVLRIQYSSYFVRKVLHMLIAKGVIKEVLGKSALTYAEGFKTNKVKIYVKDTKRAPLEAL